MNVHQVSYKHHEKAPYFFKDLSFTLEPSKLHALHGKNWIGKSVLLALLSKKFPPQAIMKGNITRGEKTILVSQRFDQMIADRFSFKENLQFACMSRFPHPCSRLTQPKYYPDFLERFDID